jgi:putative hydrolase of the HAD superfamily
MVKFVVFDFGGVFVSGGMKAARKFYGKRIGIDLDKFWHIDMRNYWNKLKTGKISEERFWEIFKKKLKRKGKDFDENEFKRLFFKYQRKNRGVAKIVKDLRKRGYKTAIISNNIKSWIDRFDEKDSLSKYFDFVICSEEVGYAKPDKKIYEIFLERAGTKPEECIFIDDKEKNLKVAEKMGMKVILFKDSRYLERQLKKILPG